MDLKPTAALVFCLLAPCSCSGSEPQPTPAFEAAVQTFVHECPGDFSFIARIEPGRVWLFLPGRTLELPQAASVSGTIYTNGAETYWNQNGEAIFESPRGRHSGCRNNRARAIWEHAKLNGVDFRASGNEPGWYLEVSGMTDILLVTEYGQRRYRFESANLKSQPHGRTTVYNAGNPDGDLLEVVITGTACRDSMSGEAFSATVSVIINDKRLTGCGRALH